MADDELIQESLRRRVQEEQFDAYERETRAANEKTLNADIRSTVAALRGEVSFRCASAEVRPLFSLPF